MGRFLYSVRCALKPLVAILRSVLKQLRLIRTHWLTNLLYGLSGFVPRDPKKWVFGAGRDAFNDNAKYLYAHVVENIPQIQATWITDNREVFDGLRAMGLSVSYRWSCAGIWRALRSKYWFYNAYISDINYYASRGACAVNLWHGIPLKKIEFDIDNGPLEAAFHRPTFLQRHIFFPFRFRRPDWVLSTSNFVSRVSFSSAFRVPESRCLNFGYPRLDPFFWSTEKRCAWVEKWGTPSLKSLIARASEYDKVFVYMPTWRDHNPNFLDEAGWDFKRLNLQLLQDRALLVLKLHMNTPHAILASAKGLTNIVLIDSKDDLYPLLPETTGLITDYSSVFFDYLLLNKPICFFAFDLDRYLSQSRSLYHAYKEFAAGPILQSSDEVSLFLRKPHENQNETERRKLAARLFDHVDSKSCERIVEFFLADPHHSHRGITGHR